MPPTGLNLKNAGVKRILQEIKEVQADTSGDFIAEALEGGVYHGRILLPAEYPFKDYTKEERRALAIKSRTTIPKFGSAERQRITDEMHARMLALPTPQARLL
ncbi:hypothetical protein QJQ45_009351 [Haematococcus lacustris]|nr:hypothetical protein QJQ45_009351 [Haematococcus lacustris]